MPNATWLYVASLMLAVVACASVDSTPYTVPSPAPPVAPPSARTASTTASPELPSDTPPEPVAEPAEPPPHYPFHDPMPEALPKDAPASIANLSAARCFAEIKKRSVPIKRVGASRGIAAAVRVTGSIGGVRYIVPGPKSQFGLLDCRLALALDALAPVLERNGVVAIQVDNFYRPRSHLPGKKRAASQHAHGLAMDVTRFTLRDGRTLVVERDWHGAVGARACGPEANPSEPSDETIALRNLICEIGREQLFHHVLTPNFDAAHRDHVHLDIKRSNPTSTVH